MKSRVIAVIWCGLLVLAGCSTIPTAVDRPLTEPQPTLRQVQNAPEQYRDRTLRWGGSIVSVTNARDGSVVEVVARTLQSSSRPDSSGLSPGRFLMKTGDFLDPEIYKEGEDITVVGALQGVETRKVGEYEYPYPVLRAEGYYLWPPVPERRVRHYDPYWDDPFMYPWWRPYPYWHHPHYYRW